MRRRTLLAGLGLAGLALPAYGFGVEPAWRLDVTEYYPAPAGWPPGLALRIAVITDLHVGEPYMGLARLEQIVATANALKPDLAVLLGDFAPGHRFISQPVSPQATMAALAQLRAPLGRFAILGNHDYWSEPVQWRRALNAAGIVLLENEVRRLRHDGQALWLAGTASTLAVRSSARRFHGLDNLPATLRRVTDDAPVILLAHEPDIFVRVPGRVALTLSGHTHGGQVRLFGYSPRIPSRFGNRFAYGHVREGGRDLIVSAGLGVSKLPVRFGVPPEVVLVRLGGTIQASNVDAVGAALQRSAA